MRSIDLERETLEYAPEVEVEGPTYLSRELADEFSLTAFPQTVLNAPSGGVESVAIRLAVTFGYRDENQLTNLVFFFRHPERKGSKLQKGEPGFKSLSREWLEIRNNLVRPILAGRPSPSSGGGGVAPSLPGPTTPAGFVPAPVESPGGGRIKNKQDPAQTDLVTVTGVGGKRIQLHRLAAGAWRAMVDAARVSGIQHPLLLPTSGYRSSAHQARLWQRALQKYGSPSEARKWVAPPGGSAHQSGRAIDLYLGSSNDSRNVARLRRTPAYQWMVKNARRFGFYPYEREPWHWEYNPPSRARELEGESEVGC
jgi:D-alanyl-D-alanine dipeptidase